MAQRRPHGQNINTESIDSAASWRAEALETDQLQSESINRRRALEETIGEGLYSTRPNPVKRRRSAEDDPIVELKKRSAERIRQEQERRLAEENEKIEQAKREASEKRRAEAQRLSEEIAAEEERIKAAEARAQRRRVLEAKALEQEKSPEQIQFRRRSASIGSENKPRRMSEEDLQDIMRQIRRERGIDEEYEQELQRRREAAQRRKRAEELAKERAEELEKRRAEDRLRQQRIHDEARRRRQERRRALEAEALREEEQYYEPEEEYEPEEAYEPEAAYEPEEEFEERRPVRKAAAKQPVKKGKGKKEKKVFTKSFKKGFFIAWGAFILVLIAAMVLLWTFLSRYENGLPEHYMNEIVEDIQEGNLESLHLVTADDVALSDPSLFGAEGTVAKYLQDKNAENKLRYVKINAESSGDENVYMIRSGDENLLKLYLDKNSGSGSENNQWSEQKTQLASEELKVTELVAQIPTTATLTINQQAVDRSFITESGSRIQILSRLIDEGIIADMPTVDTYTVKGIFAGTDVSMTDENGNSTPCSLIGDVYTAGFDADEAFAAEQTERVKSLFDPYARYFSGDAGREALSSVMLDNSPAFVSASSADVSWMQEHDGIQLSEETVTNIKKYSDSCYSCDISFVQDILRDGESVRTWDTNMTWIMVKDGDYYLADIITKTSDN